MGQHKTNPMAILAKEGKAPKKPRKMSQAESNRRFARMFSGLTERKKESL